MVRIYTRTVKIAEMVVPWDSLMRKTMYEECLMKEKDRQVKRRGRGRGSLEVSRGLGIARRGVK